MSCIGNDKLGTMYLGDTRIAKAYLGEDLVYNLSGGVTPVLPYDAEIEYLQTSGTQYINTGIKPTTNFKCEIKAQYVQNNNGFDTMLGCYDGTNYGVAVGLQSTNGGNKLYIQLGGSSSYATSNVTTTTALHTFITQLSNNTLSINVDGTTNTGTYSGNLPNMNLFLFARNKATVGNFSNAKLYYCKIWNGGNLVFDAIPVRVGTTGYMYDKISGELFGNSGTGDFIVGGDIIGNGSYVKRSYVESSNPSTIVTNIAALNSKWELELQDSVTTSGNQVFICSDSNGGHFAAVNSGGKFALGASNIMTVASTRTTIEIEFIDKGIKMTIGGASIQRVHQSLQHANYVSLLGYNNNYVYQGKIYGIKCVSGGVFDGVPAKRLSDNALGIYDLENDVFYSGNYTGA